MKGKAKLKLFHESLQNGRLTAIHYTTRMDDNVAYDSAYLFSKALEYAPAEYDFLEMGIDSAIRKLLNNYQDTIKARRDYIFDAVFPFAYISENGLYGGKSGQCDTWRERKALAEITGLLGLYLAMRESEYHRRSMEGHLKERLRSSLHLFDSMQCGFEMRKIMPALNDVHGTDFERKHELLHPIYLKFGSHFYNTNRG